MSIEMPALEVWLYVECFGWLDVTDRLRNATIRHGRTDELDTMQVGIANLTLDNRDRIFDPSNTSGPFYASMNDGEEFSAYCEVYADYGTESYGLFHGNLNGWSYEPDVSRDSTVTLEAFDSMGLWARQSTEVDAYTTMWNSPQNFDQNRPKTTRFTAWWLPMGSTAQTIADCKSNYVDPTYPAPTLSDYSFTFTTSTPLTDSAPSSYMSGASTQFDGTYGAIGPVVTMENTAGSPTNVDDTWLGFWIKTETAGPSGYLNPILSSASSATVRIGVDDGGRLAVVDAAGTLVTLFSINDGNWHQVWIRHQARNASNVLTTKALATKYDWTIYVDGVELGFARNTTWTTPNFNLIGYGSPATSDSQYFTGSLAHIQLLASTIDDATMPIVLHKAGRYGKLTEMFSGDDLLSLDVLTALEMSGVYDSHESATIGALKYGGTLIDLAQQIEIAEQGRIFDNNVAYTTGGTWVVNQGAEFQSRSYPFTSSRATTSQYTFGDADVATNIPVAAIGKIYNDIRLYRRAVNVNLPDGTIVKRYNTGITSTAGYPTETPSYDVPIFQSAANSWADAYLTKYAAPQIRVENWTVRPQTKPSTAFRACLTTKIGDRVTLDFTFGGQGSRLTKDVFVESIAHNITPELWETTFSGSPAMNAWLLEDATYGLLEDTTILA